MMTKQSLIDIDMVSLAVRFPKVDPTIGPRPGDRYEFRVRGGQDRHREKGPKRPNGPSKGTKKQNALTRALLGLWISHRLLGGGGGRLNAPPMISAPGRRREKRKAAFESSRKIISKSFRSFFGSGQN